MEVHIILLAMVTGIMFAWKIGLLHLNVLEDCKGRRLFLTVALAGNLLGFLVTFTSEGGTVYSNGHRLERTQDGDYQEKFLVSVDGEHTGSMYVEVPGKENGEEQEINNGRILSEEEERERTLREAIAAYNEKKNDPDYYYLPKEWEGKHLEWEIPKDRSGTMLAGLSLFAALAILMRRVQEEQEARRKRSEQLLMDYPGLVMKFTLLVQAGMTVRKAFQKIAADYRRKSNGQRRYAYEEVAAACLEMEGGVSEAEAYRRFGERCGQIKYKTFSILLIQNLQKGSRRMGELLEKESMEAWDERKRKARVLGELAAAKLLFPMVMMLAVVMAIIMIPAFLTFYG